MNEFRFDYPGKSWRDQNAPHNDDCTGDFESAWGHAPHPRLQARNQEYQANAIQFWRKAAQDIIATLTEK